MGGERSKPHAARVLIGAVLMILGSLSGPARADHPTDAAQVVVVSGGNASNPIRTSHTFTLRVQRADGSGINGAAVSAEIESGPNSDFANNGSVRDFVCTTSGSGPSAGQCTISYTDARGPGTDLIRFFLDHNGNRRFNPGELNTTSTKTWTGTGVTTLFITPKTDSAEVGTCNSFTAQLLDATGAPLSGRRIHVRQVHASSPATVTFCPATEGPNRTSVTTVASTGTHDKTGTTNANTDAGGRVSFGIGATLPGNVSVRVWLDTTANNVFNNGEPTDTASKTWTSLADTVTSLTVSPLSDTNSAGTQHQVTVTARNAQGAAVPGVPVRMRIVSGPNATHPTLGRAEGDVWCTTGTNGVCAGSYTSAVTGTDSLRFWVNKSTGATLGPDPGEVQVNATKTWTAGARVIDCTPKSATNPVGTNHEVICQVTDGAGGPVSGIAVTWGRVGVGDFVSQGQTTNAQGRVSGVIRSDVAGTTTVTASLPTTPAVDECERAANDPVGTPAGRCSDSVTKTWQAAPRVVQRGACRGFPFGSRQPRPDGRPGMVIVGTHGDDVLVGTSRNDIICGLRGNDTIRGGRGNDLLRGGPGDDVLLGGRGRDVLRGGRGRDVLRGGPGNDRLFGGADDDRLYGGRGDDRLDGGSGFDTCFGQAGNNIFIGCNLIVR